MLNKVIKIANDAPALTQTRDSKAALKFLAPIARQAGCEVEFILYGSSYKFGDKQPSPEIIAHLTRLVADCTSLLDALIVQPINLDIINADYLDWLSRKPIEGIRLTKSSDPHRPSVEIQFDLTELQDRLFYDVIKHLLNREPGRLSDVRCCPYCQRYFVATITKQVFCHRNCRTKYERVISWFKRKFRSSVKGINNFEKEIKKYDIDIVKLKDLIETTREVINWPRTVEEFTKSLKILNS